MKEIARQAFFGNVIFRCFAAFDHSNRLVATGIEFHSE